MVPKPQTLMSQKGSLRGQEPDTHSYLLKLKGAITGGQAAWRSLAQEHCTRQATGTAREQPRMTKCFPAPSSFIELETACGKDPLDFLGVQHLLRGAMFRPLRI